MRRVYTAQNDPNSEQSYRTRTIDLAGSDEPVKIDSRAEFNNMMKERPHLVPWEKGMGKKEPKKPWSERPGNDKLLDKMVKETVERKQCA